jgi:hypothetical protein
MAQWRLYKTAHYNYRNTTRPYPLIPQVMNGTGALRQFVPRSLGIAPGRPLAIGQRQCLNDPRCRDIQGSCGGGGCCISDDLISLLPHGSFFNLTNVHEQGTPLGKPFSGALPRPMRWDPAERAEEPLGGGGNCLVPHYVVIPGGKA